MTPQKNNIEKNNNGIWRIVDGLVFLVVGVSVVGCVGPMLNHDVGRSIGKGNHDIQLMSTTDGYKGFSYDYGIGKNVDLGLKIEDANIGLRGKYSFVNKKMGNALATTLGTGATFGGNYYMLAIVDSYRADQWEPFASVRYTYVKIDSSDFKEDKTGDVFLTIPEFNFSYVQVFVGAKYWFTNKFALSLEAGNVVDSKDVEFQNNQYYSLATEFSF